MGHGEGWRLACLLTAQGRGNTRLEIPRRLNDLGRGSGDEGGRAAVERFLQALRARGHPFTTIRSYRTALDGYKAGCRPNGTTALPIPEPRCGRSWGPSEGHGRRTVAQPVARVPVRAFRLPLGGCWGGRNRWAALPTPRNHAGCEGPLGLPTPGAG